MPGARCSAISTTYATRPLRGDPVKANVNSIDYWSDRFTGDWEAKGGREQSRFFYRLALREMPAWLVSAIRREKLTVCDWGCALGDGTDLLAQAWGTSVTGVDFSEAAIQNAKRNYSAADFLTADFLTQPVENSWDILFSSNTLEHFSDPWATLEKVSSAAKCALVVLVPFEEYNRISEHEYTFLVDNIPLTVNQFSLSYATVINAGSEQETYWAGRQIMLVYNSGDFSRRLSLALGNAQIATNLQATLEQIRGECENYKAELAAVHVSLETARNEYAAAQTEIAALQANLEKVQIERDTALRQANDPQFLGRVDELTQVLA